MRSPRSFHGEQTRQHRSGEARARGEGKQPDDQADDHRKEQNYRDPGGEQSLSSPGGGLGPGAGRSRSSTTPLLSCVDGVLRRRRTMVWTTSLVAGRGNPTRACPATVPPWSRWRLRSWSESRRHSGAHAARALAGSRPIERLLGRYRQSTPVYIGRGHRDTPGLGREDVVSVLNQGTTADDAATEAKQTFGLPADQAAKPGGGRPGQPVPAGRRRIVGL